MTPHSETGPARPTTVRTSPAGARPRPTRRGALAAVGAGAALTLLTSCGDQVRARSGHLVATDDASLVLPELDTLEDLDSHALEVPGFCYRLAGVRRTPTLRRAEAERLGFLAAGTEDAETDGEVLAPEGEEFLLAELTVEPPVVLGRQSPEVDVREERLVLGDGPGRPWPRPTALGATVRIALTVPEDPAPDAVALEVTCEGVQQRLSLVDGSRLSSDLEHWYGQWYQAVPEPLWWQREDVPGLDGTVMAGALCAVVVEPALVDGTWPGPGEILLGLEFEVLPPPAGVEALYDLALVLPDGTEATRRGRTAAEALADPDHPAAVWFAVPHDVGSLTAHLTLGLRPEGGQEISLGAEEIPVRLRPRPRP